MIGTASRSWILEGIAISGVSLKTISDFAILITHSTAVNITAVTIEDSGTLDSRGLSNTTGGILLEQGTANFTVTHCRIRNVTGNGIWTHSTAEAQRNQDGRITGNEIWGTPRDAVQVGHAARIQVLDNSGGQIGYPVEQVDLPAQATPVAMDSAGNVSESVYSGNHFEDVNGQCIDLDGFHDGQVVNNSCVNRKSPGDYPLSHVGIVFGNSNPEMTSRNVTLSGNLIQGFGYGAVYLIGKGHEISGNRFVDVNRNHCTGDMRFPPPGYAPDEPGMLRERHLPCQPIAAAPRGDQGKTRSRATLSAASAWINGASPRGRKLRPRTTKFATIRALPGIRKTESAEPRIAPLSSTSFPASAAGWYDFHRPAQPGALDSPPISRHPDS